MKAPRWLARSGTLGMLCLAAWASGCKRAPLPVAPPAKPVVQPEPEADELPRPPANPSGRWHVTRAKVHAEVAEDQHVAGLDDAALSTAVAESVGKMAQVLGLGPPPASVADVEQVEVLVAVAWQQLDDNGKPRSTQGPPQQGAIVMSLTAHAERPVPKGQPDVAERTLDLSLPLPAERAEALAAFLTTKVQEAAVVATADALGELWARGLADAAILALLDDNVLWHQVAGAREVGERGLKAGRDRLEKLARDSRKDLAVVAVAALGRLGDPHSVAPLIACLDAAHVEVVDAALVALADLATQPALAALQQAADSHVNREIRQRAAALLQERAAHRRKRGAEHAPAGKP